MFEKEQRSLNMQNTRIFNFLSERFDSQHIDLRVPPLSRTGSNFTSITNMASENSMQASDSFGVGAQILLTLAAAVASVLICYLWGLIIAAISHLEACFNGDPHPCCGDKDKNVTGATHQRKNEPDELDFWYSPFQIGTNCGSMTALCFVVCAILLIPGAVFSGKFVYENSDGNSALHFHWCFLLYSAVFLWIILTCMFPRECLSVFTDSDPRECGSLCLGMCLVVGAAVGLCSRSTFDDLVDEDRFQALIAREIDPESRAPIVREGQVEKRACIDDMDKTERLTPGS